MDCFGSTALHDAAKYASINMLWGYLSNAARPRYSWSKIMMICTQLKLVAKSFVNWLFNLNNLEILSSGYPLDLLEFIDSNIFHTPCWSCFSQFHLDLIKNIIEFFCGEEASAVSKTILADNIGNDSVFAQTMMLGLELSPCYFEHSQRYLKQSTCWSDFWAVMEPYSTSLPKPI